jgi:hypothetical protein
MNNVQFISSSKILFKNPLLSVGTYQIQLSENGFSWEDTKLFIISYGYSIFFNSQIKMHLISHGLMEIKELEKVLLLGELS